MNPKSASALSWLALILNGLGVMTTALGAQFLLSALAAILAILPAVLARGRARIFGIVVLVISLALVFTGYPKYQRDTYRTRQGARQSYPLSLICFTSEPLKPDVEYRIRISNRSREHPFDIQYSLFDTLRFVLECNASELRTNPSGHSELFSS
jgi:membrane protein implicated in regulation of membrane protease activity